MRQKKCGLATADLDVLSCSVSRTHRALGLGDLETRQKFFPHPWSDHCTSQTQRFNNIRSLDAIPLELFMRSDTCVTDNQPYLRAILNGLTKSSERKDCNGFVHISLTLNDESGNHLQVAYTTINNELLHISSVERCE